MKRIVLILFLVLAARPLSALVDWFDPAYLESNTQFYGTGFINVPYAGLMPHGWLSTGLHRYQAKLNYGLWNTLELGITSDVEGYTDLRNIASQTLLFGRLRFLQQEKAGINLAVGVDGIGWEDLGFATVGFVPDPQFEFKDTGYVVMGRTLPWIKSMVATVGYGTSFPHPGIPAQQWFFANVSQVVLPGMMVMGERDREGWNVGTRMLLSTEIKLDFVIFQAQTINRKDPFAQVLDRNIRFGISYTEKWPRS